MNVSKFTVILWHRINSLQILYNSLGGAFIAGRTGRYSSRRCRRLRWGQSDQKQRRLLRSARPIFRGAAQPACDARNHWRFWPTVRHNAYTPSLSHWHVSMINFKHLTSKSIFMGFPLLGVLRSIHYSLKRIYWLVCSVRFLSYYCNQRTYRSNCPQLIQIKGTFLLFFYSRP